MSLEPLPLVLVLLSALMHAAWNLIAKMGQDRLIAMAVIKGTNTVLALTVLVAVGIPASSSWAYLAASCAINCVYFYFLINAYRGDLSLAYPVSRGVAPLLVLVLSAVAAREAPSEVSFAGVLLVSIAILVLAQRGASAAWHTQTMLWAGGVGLTIALSTVMDGLGGRHSDNVIGYVSAQNAITGVAVCGAAYLLRGRHALASGMQAYWKSSVLGGALMLLGYIIVVYALTIAPMAHVAAVRESSVIFAAVLGVIVLREPFGGRRILASVILTTGIALLVLAR